MTRKHFQAVAKLLNDFQDRVAPETFGELVSAFGEIFKADNPNFDQDKFVSAVFK